MKAAAYTRASDGGLGSVGISRNEFAFGGRGVVFSDQSFLYVCMCVYVCV